MDVTYGFLEQFGIIGFIVLQIIFVSVLSWLIGSVRNFRKELKTEMKTIEVQLISNLDSIDKRVNTLEVQAAVREETIRNFVSLMTSMDKKLDIILDPHFFERCPKIHKGEN
jgi:Sec-independent protein translocase protein TatA